MVLAAASALAGATAASAQLPPAGGEPSSAPAKARVAFVADRSVYTITADGSARRRLTDPAEGRDAGPAWSPDGGLIAFTRYTEEGEDEGPSSVRIVGADGSGERALTSTLPGDTHQSNPAWSPDGRRIVFVQDHITRKRAVTSLVTSGPGGEDPRVIHRETTVFGDDDSPLVFLESPSWAPGGDRILYTRSTYGGGEDSFRPALHVVPAAGGQPQLLARDADHGSWSPDGSRLAYAEQRERDGKPCQLECIGVGDIAVMNADGSGRTRLTRSPADDAAPSWSADGGRIVFHSDRNALLEGEDEEAPEELYAIRPDGSCLTWLTNGTAHSTEPAWEPSAALSSDPGACGPTPREPLVETDTRRVEAVKRFPVWWLGRVAPNGLLLTDVGVTRNVVVMHYGDCGRFDPAECGRSFANVTTKDLCAGRSRLLTSAGVRGNPTSIFRVALLSVNRDPDGYGYSDLYSGRSRIVGDTPSGRPLPTGLLDGLRRVGDESSAPGAPMPSARLPVRYWRTLTSVTAAYRRLGSVTAVARKLKISRGEVIRRRAAAKRLAELGVKRRLGCS